VDSNQFSARRNSADSYTTLIAVVSVLREIESSLHRRALWLTVCGDDSPVLSEVALVVEEAKIDVGVAALACWDEQSTICFEPPNLDSSEHYGSSPHEIFTQTHRLIVDAIYNIEGAFSLNMGTHCYGTLTELLLRLRRIRLDIAMEALARLFAP
jgi:hypothetical protein